MKCKACHNGLESLSHILNGCLLNKKQQTDRHNRVIDTLLKHYSKGGKTVVNKNEKYGNGSKLRPDILIRTNEDCQKDFLIDVVVSFEYPQYFSDARKSKIQKYNHLAELHMNSTGKPLRILPLVVGYLGSLTYELKNILRLLKIGPNKFRKIATEISTGVMVDSFDIYMDYLYPNRKSKGKGVVGVKKQTTETKNQIGSPDTLKDLEPENTALARPCG
ncbi:Retrovirus-related Pol polyprotein from type-1 retrotransposable element R2 [Thelohanellus kitauei]|uniref:Retrovirus-related Pol polyprotein from type-1 retrotransposable element R2 n=1 Tax=Thelohanellus kitauei TaxID=669202 RepID=A0A0C2N9Q8_THEKT|nr:Retrovirus-related Pol polyprotein from type-1 retrotransposable element R2 [Thelohanellus kitauei]